MLILILDALPGEYINDAAKEMIRLSKLLNVYTEINVNGITMYADPYETEDGFIAKYHKKLHDSPGEK